MHSSSPSQTEYAPYNDMIVPGSSYWTVALAREAGKVVEDTEALETVDRFAENLAWLAERLAE